MKTSITKGLTNDEAAEMTADFKAAYVLRRRIVELLEAKASNAEKESISKDRYESPNWAYIQADTVGFKRALSEVISLLKD